MSEWPNIADRLDLAAKWLEEAWNLMSAPGYDYTLLTGRRIESLRRDAIWLRAKQSALPSPLPTRKRPCTCSNGRCAECRAAP